jgi:hypothetical protein
MLDKCCKFFFIVSKFSVVKVIVFKTRGERTLNLLVENIRALYLSNPRMKHDFFDSDVRPKSDFLFFLQQLIEEVFDLVRKLNMGRKAKFFADDGLLQ